MDTNGASRPTACPNEALKGTEPATWGVLDRLIEATAFDDISSMSARAMNATLFASWSGRRQSTGLPGT